MLIGITGSPASGKSTFAKALKQIYKDIRIIEISKVAKAYNAYSSIDNDGTLVANMGNLKYAIKKEIRSTKAKHAAIVGHMAQDLGLKLDICITIRAKPKSLYARQKARGYSLPKIKENIISEALDYCGIGASKACKLSFEVETAREKAVLAKYIAGLMRRNKGASGVSMPRQVEALRARKDMMGQFLSFIGKNNIGF